MYRYPKLAHLNRFFVIQSDDSEAQRIGRLLQLLLGIVVLGLFVRLGVRVQEQWSTADLLLRTVGQLVGIAILATISYLGVRYGRAYATAHFIFTALFVGEIIVLWPTAGTAHQHSYLLLLYLVAVMGILPVRHSAPYVLFCLLAAVRLETLGIDSARYIITSFSLVLIVWVIARAQKNALRQAQLATQELANLNATLQEQVEQQTAYLRHSNERLQTSLAVGRAASASLNLNEQLYNAAKLIRDEFGFYHVTIFLMDESNQYLVLREATGEVGQQQKREGFRLRLGDSQSVVGWVAQRREARLASPNQPPFTPHPLLPHTQAELALPLLTRNFLVGVLDVQSDQPHGITAEDMTVLQLMADQLANNIENGMLFAELEQRTSNLAKLQTIATLMNEQANTQNALNVLAQQAQSLIQADGSSVWLWNRVEGVLELVHEVGFTLLGQIGNRLQPNQGLTGRTFTSNQTNVLEDYATWEERLWRDEQNPLHAMMAVPIRERGTPLGVLLVARQLSTEPFNADEVQVIELLASQAGTIITNQQLIEETQQLARRERALNQVSAEIRRSLDAEMVLESAANNLGQLLRDQRITVRLYPTPETTTAAPSLMSET